jgi:hypothetical protein
MPTGYGRRNLDHDREIYKQTNNKFSRELLGNGVVEELADGDIHDEYLMIYCCLISRMTLEGASPLPLLDGDRHSHLLVGTLGGR